MHDIAIRSQVEDYYGRILQKSADLKTNACCATGKPPLRIRQALTNIHDDVLSRFYGCGYPVPEGLSGTTVVDLGCGSGRDVYLLSQFVGAAGRVVGVDMTAEQLTVARQTQEWHRERFKHETSNVEFHQGYIEDLSDLNLNDGEVDVFVSNCVVNLSPRKDLVLKEAYRLLKPGGEFYLSDVVVDRRLPEDVATDPVLYGECLGGAWYDADFAHLAKSCGFLDPREIVRAPIEIQNEEVEAKVGAARFFSVTYRLFKIDGLEPRCEDYGQVATYRGTLDGQPHRFALDDHHFFETGRPERVCGNTAAMLAETRYADHFVVSGDKTKHFGEFPCEPTMATPAELGDGACC